MTSEISKTILVIDDDETIRDLLKALLEENGYNVILKENGAQGVNAFHNNHIDLIITDILMPEQEGIETIKIIRNTDVNIPIIVISGTHCFNTADYTGMATAFGADYSIKKPFSNKTILSTINLCFNKKS